MDYTRALNHVVHATTGHRMHQQTEAVPTEISAGDLNGVMWSLMEVVNAAGMSASAAPFNPNDPATYSLLRLAIQALAVQSGDPIGTVKVGYYGTSAPTGYVLVTGQTLSRTTDAALWAHAQAIGAVVSEAAWQAGDAGKFSTGDGATTFRLPLLGGQHVRIVDDGAGIDSGRVLGSLQSDQMPAHSHTYRKGLTTGPGTAGGGDANIARTWSDTELTGTTGTGSEVRVKTVALRAIMKRW